MIRRFGFWFFSLLLIGAPVGASAAEKLNVVLILADDLGWADLGCYGSKYHRTPHLDRLASEGMKFNEGYAACPVCSPTRAALMTGKYPARLNLTDWLPGRGDRPDQKLLRPKINQQLPLDEVTLAESLKAAGYVTGHIGKWHLGGTGFGPRDQGFDFNIGGDHTGTPLSYFAPYLVKRDGKEIVMPGLENAPAGEYLTDRYALEAEKFIEANQSKPFFLYLPHNAVHTPMKAKAELVAQYEGQLTFGKQSNPIYAAMLQSLDEAVGRVLAKLEALKIADRTLVIFTSDNGGLATLEGPNTPATINSPQREGKGWLYEGGIRVPLIVKWPGVTKPGSTTDSMVASHDIFATVIEACGAKAPDGIDGKSFSNVLKDSKATARNELFWHYPHYANQGGKPGAAIREGNFKLIEFYENGRRELFDVKQGENSNLAESKKDVVERLAAKLDAWRKEVGAQMMSPNPNYVPNPQGKNGNITLPASTAEVFGVMLRYEPLPHKNTLGYWVNQSDWAKFEFTVTEPGTFVVEPHQGCGTGQGGSVVAFTVGDQSLEMTVEDTGHFQNFKPREIGTIKIDKPGRYELHVKPKTKAKAAVMDIRQIVLKKQS